MASSLRSLLGKLPLPASRKGKAAVATIAAISAGGAGFWYLKNNAAGDEADISTMSREDKVAAAEAVAMKRKLGAAGDAGSKEEATAAATAQNAGGKPATEAV